MDCEKFDTHVIDALYDELDEVTHAAMRRHLDSCSRCSAVLSGFRATRDVGVLPIEQPSDDFEDRIMAAVQTAQRKAPWHRKAIRGIAWAGSHAMRPQLAMAAVLVLMLGSSVLLLRAKPGSLPMSAKSGERGVPVAEAPAATAIAQADDGKLEARGVAASPAPAAPPPTAALDTAEEKARAKAGGDEDQGRADRARTGAGAESKEADSALADARATKTKAGCSAAVGKYDSVGSKYPRTEQAALAMWEAAECYQSMGETAKAREIYMALRSVDGYAERAERELQFAEAPAAKQNQVGGSAARPPAAAARSSPKAAARAAEADQSADPSNSGSAGKGEGKDAAPAKPATGY